MGEPTVHMLRLAVAVDVGLHAQTQGASVGVHCSGAARIAGNSVQMDCWTHTHRLGDSTVMPLTRGGGSVDSDAHGPDLRLEERTLTLLPAHVVAGAVLADEGEVGGWDSGQSEPDFDGEAVNEVENSVVGYLNAL